MSHMSMLIVVLSIPFGPKLMVFTTKKEIGVRLLPEIPVCARCRCEISFESAYARRRLVTPTMANDRE